MHHAGCEMPHRCVRRKCRFRRSSASSLTDSLRSVVRLRRADSPFAKAVTPLSTESGDNPEKNMCAKKRKPRKRPRRRRFFHRLRPPDGLHKTDTFSVHLWEPYGSTMKSASGGETRRGLKIITVSGESLPPAPPRSRHIDYRIPFPPFSLAGHVALSHSSRLLVSRGDLGSSLRAGLYAGTPRSARLLRLLR